MSGRVPVVPDFQPKRWRFRQGNLLSWCGSIESLDEKVWSTCPSEHPHPLYEFWSDRFLIYPNDPSSRPLKKQIPSPSTTVVALQEKEKENEDTKSRFSLKDYRVHGFLTVEE
jgi:hypothetical protein